VANRKAKCAKQLAVFKFGYMNKNDSSIPGYTVTESNILHEMLDAMYYFVNKDGWETQSPTELSRSFVHDTLGNHIRFTLKLYTELNEDDNQLEFNLFFGNRVEGSKKERGSHIEGSLFLSFGNQNQVKTDILLYKNNIEVVQEKLYENYYGIFITTKFMV